MHLYSKKAQMNMILINNIIYTSNVKIAYRRVGGKMIENRTYCSWFKEMKIVE